MNSYKFRTIFYNIEISLINILKLLIKQRYTKRSRKG